MATAQGGREPDAGLHDVDWEAVEQTPEFQELVPRAGASSSRRRSSSSPGTSASSRSRGYAPDFMAESVYEGLTVGYVPRAHAVRHGRVLGLMYLRRAAEGLRPARRQGRRDRVAQRRARATPRHGGLRRDRPRRRGGAR